MKMKLPLIGIFLLSMAAAACRSMDSDSGVLDSTPPGVNPDQLQSETPPVPEPFAKGDANGLKWEARFNFPPCDHPGKKKGVWCMASDQKAAAEQSGVEAELTAWANDPKIKSVTLAYFSFSDQPVIKMLCEAANNRGLKVTVYLHKQNISTPGAQKLATCSPEHISVIARGTEFGTGYLQHAKIFLASEFLDPLPLHLMPEEERAAAAETTTRFTSSSANMSSYGTSLHLDNWLFFASKTNEYLAQENLCFFYAVKNMILGDGNTERKDFAQKNNECIKGIQIPMREDIVFYPVPHANITRAIYPAIKAAMDAAQSQIKVVIHRLTTAKIYAPLVQAKGRGVDVKVINDDDTLRSGKCNGGPQLDQSGQDVQANRLLTAAGVPVTYLETNGEISQLAHNKFMVIDEKILLQGAGNFTATSLNSGGMGNMEHFYLITTPEIVQAYSKAWDYLRSVSTAQAEHEVGANEDVKLVPGQFGLEIDPSSCH